MSRKLDRNETALLRAAPVFAALGDPTRLRVVARLCVEGPRSATALSRGSKVSRQAIQKHLNALSEAGLVGSCSHGRERLWEIESAGLTLAQSYLDYISAQWDAALARLKAFVEEGSSE
jgi:DNA-binding transcriptional ArsR family regulator